jgi:hypothetical protein
MFKHVFVGLIIGVLLAVSVGMFPVFKMKQYVIRKEIKRRIKNSIPEEELHVLTFHSPESDVEWVREGKEFILGDRMYDVVHQEIKGDSTVFHCVNDKEEAILFAHLEDYVQKELQGNSKQSKKKRTNGKIFRLQLFCDAFIIPFNLYTEADKNVLPAYTFRVKTNFPEISPQPPQV